MQLLSSLSVSLLLASGVPAFGQSAANTDPFHGTTLAQLGNPADLIPSLTRVLYDDRGEGILYARAKSWKAQFGPEGSTYIPFLGADAPRNFPVRFRLAEVVVGGQSLQLAARPVVTREGDRIVLDHGPIQEIYDLGVESMEQSFRLPRRAQAGEVIVRMDVDSELDGQPDGRGLRFTGQHGGVNYGEAFAIDTLGQRVDVASRLDQGSLELRVPDALSMEGDGEILIDPVLSTFTVSNGGLQVARNADIAFDKDVDGGVYVVVYELAQSSTDTDVYSAEIVKATGVVRNVAALDLSSDDWRFPRVAGNDAGNAFLMVSQVEPVGGGGLTDIVSRLRVGGGAGLSLPNPINPAPGAEECFTPDVGGESLAAGGSWCVVWSQDLGGTRAIRAQQIAATGSVLGFPLFLSPGGVQDSEPAISESSGEYLGGDYRFNIAWTRRNGPTDRDVFAAQVEPSFTGLNLVTSGFSLGMLGDAHSPTVSSLSSQIVPATGERAWVVASVYEGLPDSAILVQPISGSTVHAFKNVLQMEDDLFVGSYVEPSVAYTGNGFVLAYTSGDVSGSTKAFMNTFYLPETTNGVTVAMAERRQNASASNSDHADTDLVSEWESGLVTSDEGMMCFSRIGTFGFSDVRVAGFEAYNTPAIGSQYCRAFFNSELKNGWLAMYGSPSAGGTNVALGTDMPPGQFTYMLCSMTQGNVVNPGGSQGRLCLGGDVGRLLGTLTSVLPSGTALFLVDSAELQTPGGPVVALPGETWNFQSWHRDVVGGSPTSNFTNAVSVQYQ